jgi:hypothetical protein
MRTQRFSRCFATVVVLASCCTTAHAQVDAETLKAAFVYNFALYTTWPTPLRDAAMLTVCVARTSTLLPALRALEGKKVQLRSLAVREIEADARPNACDILVVTPQGPKGLPTDRGLLTICDCNAEGHPSGATIGLVREGDRLRFDVDRNAASKAGLSLSSKLLRLARNAP